MPSTTKMEGVQKQSKQKQKIIPETQEDVESGMARTIPIARNLGS